MGIWGSVVHCLLSPPPFFKKPLHRQLEISPENGVGLKGGEFNNLPLSRMFSKIGENYWSTLAVRDFL